MSKHRRPLAARVHPIYRVLAVASVAGLAAVALIGPRLGGATNQPSLGAAPVGLSVPAGLSASDLHAWCQSRLDAGTAGLSSGSVYWLRSCVNVSAPVPTATPTPSTSTSTPSTPTSTPSTPSSPASSTGSGQTPTGAFPDATTTGVPAGTALSNAVPSCVSVQSWGWLVPTGRDGCVINAALIPSEIEVQANNVVIRNSRVMCSSGGCISQTSGSINLTVSHTEIGPNSGYSNVNGARAIDGHSGLTVDSVNIHNVVDGIWPGSNSVIRDSYIHNLDISSDGAHSDGIQSTGGTSNVQVIHNTIEGGNTSGLLVQKLDGLDNAWVINDNQLLGRSASGGTTSYAIGFDAAACPANTCQFRNNVLNRTWEVGPSYTPTNWTSASWSANTYQDGNAIPVPA